MFEILAAIAIFVGVAIVMAAAVIVPLRSVLRDAAAAKRRSGRRWYQFSVATLLTAILLISVAAALTRQLYRDTIGREQERKARLIDATCKEITRPDDPQDISLRRSGFEFTSERPFVVLLIHDCWDPTIDNLDEFRDRYTRAAGIWPREGAATYRVKSQLRDEKHVVELEIEANVYGWTARDATGREPTRIAAHEFEKGYDRIGTETPYRHYRYFQRHRGHGVFMYIRQWADRTKRPKRPPFWQREDWFYIQFEDTD